MRLRAFCLHSLAGLTVIAVAHWAVAGQLSRRKSVPLTGLHFETFAGEVGAMFHVQSSGRRVLALRLIRADRGTLPGDLTEFKAEARSEFAAQTTMLCRPAGVIGQTGRPVEHAAQKMGA